MTVARVDGKKRMLPDSTYEWAIKELLEKLAGDMRYLRGMQRVNAIAAIKKQPFYEAKK